MAVQSGETFAGLVQAVVDSGLDPCVLEVLESCGVRTLVQTKALLVAGTREPELNANLQAIVFTAFGPQAIAARQSADAVSGAVHVGSRKRRDLPTPQISSGGSFAKALRAAAPENRQFSLEAFQADIVAKSNSHCQGSRWKTWARIAAAWGVQPAAPLTTEVVMKVRSSFKLGGYKNNSSRQYTRQVYLSRARRWRWPYGMPL